MITLTGAANASFRYDGLNRRRAKTVSGITTRYLYDGLNVVQEQNATGTSTANLLTGLGIDEVFRRTDSAGAQSYFLDDALGSTVALTDGTGTVQTQYTYEPFGKTTTSGAANGNPFQYTGRENDGTGLYYYRARYYHPVFQRFISEDPIEYAGGDFNLYAYVGNDPISKTDPLGLIDGFPSVGDLIPQIGPLAGYPPADLTPPIATRTCIASCGFDFVNPLENIVAEKAAEQTGKTLICDTAGDVAKAATKQAMKVIDAYSLAVCLRSCK